MELLGDMANRDHLIIADAIVSKKSAPETVRLILRDEEVPALFTNKISPASAGRLADVLSALRFTGEFPEKADPGRRNSGITGAAHRLDADGRSDD